MEGAWPAAPRAASRSPEPEPESESGGERAGHRRSAQLQIGPDGKLLRCAAAAERGEWSEGGSWERGRAARAALPMEPG